MQFRPFALDQLKLLALKLGAMLSFCGGPMMAGDLLKPSVGSNPAFLLAYGPVAIAVLGAFSLSKRDPWNWGRWAVWMGLAGVAIVVAMDVVAIARLAGGYSSADRGLIVFGVIVGLVSAAFYAALARRRLQAVGDG